MKNNYTIISIILICAIVISCNCNKYNFSNYYNISSDNVNLKCIKAKKEQLIKIKEILVLSEKISQNNIENCNNTYSFKNGIFNMVEIKIISENLNYKVVINNKYKYIYDPGHPDAIQHGKYKGYVAYPNIDVQAEKNNIMNCEKEIKKLENQ